MRAFCRPDGRALPRDHGPVMTRTAPGGRVETACLILLFSAGFLGSGVAAPRPDHADDDRDADRPADRRRLRKPGPRADHRRRLATVDGGRPDRGRADRAGGEHRALGDRLRPLPPAGGQVRVAFFGDGRSLHRAGQRARGRRSPADRLPDAGDLGRAVRRRRDRRALLLPGRRADRHAVSQQHLRRHRRRPRTSARASSWTATGSSSAPAPSSCTPTSWATSWRWRRC